MRAHHAVAATFAVLALSSTALAKDSTIKQPGEHPDYHLDVEPHGLLALGGWYNSYGALGFGGGVRISMPLCLNCFIPKINNNVAISFGGDLGFFPGCYNNGNSYCGATLFYAPVAMQWNFFVAQKWTVFGEVGFTPVFQIFDDRACGGCSHFGAYPNLAFGGRYHFNEKVALTMRLGFPAFTIGVSFWL